MKRKRRRPINLEPRIRGYEPSINAAILAGFAVCLIVVASIFGR